MAMVHVPPAVVPLMHPGSTLPRCIAVGGIPQRHPGPGLEHGRLANGAPWAFADTVMWPRVDAQGRELLFNGVRALVVLGRASSRPRRHESVGGGGGGGGGGIGLVAGRVRRDSFAAFEFEHGGDPGGHGGKPRLHIGTQGGRFSGCFKGVHYIPKKTQKGKVPSQTQQLPAATVLPKNR